MQHDQKKPTVGSLFAGIGGFDIGFERAGFITEWQVEIDDIARAVLADRFPIATQHRDVREVGSSSLSQVDVLLAGFPCQDISNSGAGRKKGRQGLKGERSGLFYEVSRIIKEIRPRWVVLENVAALTYSNKGKDFAAVIGELQQCGYVGCWRTLDAQYFGSPNRRRRVFLVAGLGEHPPTQLLSDAAPVEAISSALTSEQFPREANAWPGYTLQANNSASRITLGGQVLVAEENRWDQMDERRRMSEEYGFKLGLDEANLTEVKGAGNAVATQVSEWIARKLIKTF